MILSYPLYKAIFVWQTKFTIKRSYLLVITNVGFYAYSSLAAGRVELKIPPDLDILVFCFLLFLCFKQVQLIAWNWLLYSVDFLELVVVLCMCLWFERHPESQYVRKVTLLCLLSYKYWRVKETSATFSDAFFCVCICFIKPKLAQASIIWCGTVAKAISIGNLLQVYYS